MSMPNPAPSTSWTVTGTAETTQIAADGTVVRGVNVYFTTGAGQSGTVFIPGNQLAPDTARALIAARAQLLDQVAALTSES